MIHNSFLRTIAIGLFALSMTTLPGCVVGNAISDGYENFTTYFNAYYNASKLFSDAEDEIQSAALLARGKQGQAKQDSIPSSAKQKLFQVIDKCSNIMAYHPASSLVDDALLMTGKSFYYMWEYRKAERKFEELLAQYPHSSLSFEARLWMARSKDKLRETDEAIQMTGELLAAAQTNNVKDIESEAARLLAALYRQKGMFSEAEKYYDISIQYGSNDEKTQADIELADVYFTEAHYEEAVKAYSKVEQYTSDNYIVYYAKLQTALAYRQMKQFDQSEQRLNAMALDFHYKEYLPIIRLERAKTYFAAGKTAAAANEYFSIDTTFARTPYAYRAAQELAAIYEKEKELRDYKLALKYYTEAANGGQDASMLASKKSHALTRYFASYATFHQTDSLMALLADTSTQTLRDSLAKIMADTLGRAKNDTTIKKIQAAITAKKNLLSADSLMVLKSIAAHDLGDVFYEFMENSDSAIVWYTHALKYHYDAVRSPRILFILAELSNTHAGEKYSMPGEYYEKLEHDFPASVYTAEARRLLGKPNVSSSDTAAERYRQAEQYVDAKAYDKAQALFASIPADFPNSRLAPKSDYAVAWVWEYGLLNSDSALAQYKRVVKKYPGTIFAAQASRRFIEQADTAKKDTAALHPAPPLSAPRDVPQPNQKLATPPAALPDSSDRSRPQIPNEGRKPRRPVGNE
ncbi:MAG TPA: tetratricopeptide repeat protein [Bacteroidota bacterium]|nr:tetratricopeptide repeat protein [Bacteroidota bacterium]